MNAHKLEAMRAELARQALTSTDETLIERALALFGISANAHLKKEKLERIPGLPYTKEERIASAMQGLEEYKQGLGISTDELRKRAEAW